MRSLLVRLVSVSLSVSLLLFASHALAAADGAALYKAKCASCHGPDGKAETPAAKAMKVPALAGKGLTAADVTKQLRTNEKHKALSSLTDEEVAAIAGALPH
jgi:mono/diheme cytochrome c family protein